MPLRTKSEVIFDNDADWMECSCLLSMKADFINMPHQNTSEWVSERVSGPVC